LPFLMALVNTQSVGAIFVMASAMLSLIELV